ncbi:MAG: hypothetical protein JXR65_05945 [Bacteroidales bacterium]|nr:hypothetical protein [Bacteroidales bacterium]
MPKRKSSKADYKISFRNIIFVIIILAAIAALITYLIYQPETNNNNNPGPSASQIEIPKVTPPSLSATQTKTIIDGNWVSDETGTMLDLHGSKFNIDSPSVDNHTYFEGNFSLSGNEITFFFNGKNNPCQNQPGVYTYIIKNKQLILKVKTDSCNVRKSKLDGAWVHL